MVGMLAWSPGPPSGLRGVAPGRRLADRAVHVDAPGRDAETTARRAVAGRPLVVLEPPLDVDLAALLQRLGERRSGLLPAGHAQPGRLGRGAVLAGRGVLVDGDAEDQLLFAAIGELGFRVATEAAGERDADAVHVPRSPASPPRD